MIETIDECFGRVFDALECIGEDLAEWIIVYTPDHGEMLGQHGVWENGYHFEAGAGVPLVIRWPKRFDPTTVEKNVSLCDLFATLCDLVDVPVPADHTLDSRSLVPLMMMLSFHQDAGRRPSGRTPSLSSTIWVHTWATCHRRCWTASSKMPEKSTANDRYYRRRSQTRPRGEG